jgi:hypothetical protein
MFHFIVSCPPQVGLLASFLTIPETNHVAAVGEGGIDERNIALKRTKQQEK